MIKMLDSTASAVLSDSAVSTGVNDKRIMYHITKRLFDIICSFIGCLFLIPIAIVLKIAFMLTGDFKSIFYSQDRIGKNGKYFKFYKFRSMVPNADEALQEILRTDKELAKEYRRMKKFHDDPRITKVGRFIRRTSIDELPQLINIFMGDMSFIGNRPYLPREKKDMGEYYDEIVKTKPGLTGFWQASLRSRGTFLDRLKMEKYYSNNYSLKFDISIFFKTLSTLFDKESAK